MRVVVVVVVAVAAVVVGDDVTVDYAGCGVDCAGDGSSSSRLLVVVC